MGAVIIWIYSDDVDRIFKVLKKRNVDTWNQLSKTQNLKKVKCLPNTELLTIFLDWALYSLFSVLFEYFHQVAGPYSALTM